MAGSGDTSSERRYQPADVRRRQILDAAARLAIQQGLDGTSIAEIAVEAGVAKGSIYLHFDSRQDVIAGLQAEVWSRMMEEPRAIAARDQLSWTERLDLVVAHWMRYESEHQDLYHAVFHTVATDAEEPWTDARTLLRQLVDGGVAAGEFELTGLDPGVVVDFLLHAYAGPCMHGADIVAATTDVQRLFRRALGTQADHC